MARRSAATMATRGSPGSRCDDGAWTARCSTARDRRASRCARARSLVLSDDVVRGVVVDDGAGPEPLPARLVVGADGRRSVVARRLGLLHEHPRLRKFAVRGYWTGVEGLTSHGEMHVTRGGYCGIAPLGHDEANITFVLDRNDMGPAAGDLDRFYRRTL